MYIVTVDVIVMVSLVGMVEGSPSPVCPCMPCFTSPTGEVLTSLYPKLPNRYQLPLPSRSKPTCMKVHMGVGGVVAVYILKCTRGMRLGLERLGAVKLTFYLFTNPGFAVLHLKKGPCGGGSNK